MLAIAFISMVVVAVTTVSSLKQSVGGINNVINEGLQPALNVSGIGLAVKNGESELYQLLTQSAAGSEVDVEQEVLVIQGNLSKIISQLQELLKLAKTDKQLTSLKSAIDDLTQYHDAIEVVGSMVELDFASAVGMLEPFSNLSDNVNKTIQELIKQSSLNAENIAHQTAGDAETAEDIASTVTITSIIILLIISLFIVHGMTSRLKKLSLAIVEVAETGEFSHQFKIEGKDEVGLAGEAFRKLLQNVGTTMEEVTRVMEAMASGHFVNISKAKRESLTNESKLKNAKGQLDRLRYAVRVTEAHLAHTIDLASSAAQHLSSSVIDLSSNQEELNQQSDIQQQSVIHTVNDMNEIAEMIEATDKRTTAFNDVIRTTAKQTKASEEMVIKALDAMTSIAEANNNVVKISGKIDEIAAHTNLLALNASIESARAGEHGRGFSVVADEIRRLAISSTESTSEIKKLIDDTSLQIDEGSNLVKEVSESMNAITEKVNDVSKEVDQITYTSSQQKLRVDTVNESMDELKNINDQNKTLTEQVSSTFKSMEDKTNHLVNLMDFFKIEGEREE